MKSYGAAGLAVAVVLSVVVVSCHKTTEQERVKKVINEVVKAVEAKEIRSVLGHLSKSYADPQGHDYDGIKGLLLMYFYRHQRISVYIPGIEVMVTEATARAVFEAVLSGGNTVRGPQDILPEALGAYLFEVSFTKESGEWKVTSAVWRRAGEEGQ